MKNENKSWGILEIRQRTTKDYDMLHSDRPIKCSGCGKLVKHAHMVSIHERYCTIECYIRSNPMILTGDESKLDKIAADLAENRCSGRKPRR